MGDPGDPCVEKYADISEWEVEGAGSEDTEAVTDTTDHDTVACPLKFKVLSWSSAICPELCLSIRGHQKKIGIFGAQTKRGQHF